MLFEGEISIIREELQKPLPGKTQQYLMAPEFRGNILFPAPARKAAVMLCIYPGMNDMEIVFIKRTAYDGPHSAQVSFPGGSFEEHDEDLTNTAIRETFEETGVSCTRESVIGGLTPLRIPVSNMQVFPFVGYIEKTPVFKIDPREVDYVFTAEISTLLDPSCIRKEKWMLHGVENLVPFYHIKNEVIWGATSMMLCEFLAVISRSGLYQQSRY